MTEYLKKEPLKEGWVWASNWNKSHYIRNSKSLCGKWMYLGKDPEDFEKGNDDSADNCTACKKVLQKERAKETLEGLKRGRKVEF